MPGTLQQFPDYTAAFSLVHGSQRGINKQFRHTGASQMPPQH
jgi:hypothetical protein